MSAPPPTAWDLTRLLSPRGHVRVMKRDAYGRVDENSYPGTHRLGPHPPDTPWALHLADDTGVFRLLCFDFDGKTSTGPDPDLTERAHDDCDALSAILDRLGIRHLVCQSSSTGGRHIWIALRGGATADQVAAVARSARAAYRTLDHGMLHNPRTGAARPPLSPHRDGSLSTILRGRTDSLTQPSTTAADLTALTAALDAARPAPRAADTAPSGPVDNTHRTHRPLTPSGTAHMGTIGGGSNPSWTGFMCLLAAAHAGWPTADIEHAAATAPGMEHYRTKNTGRGGRRPRTTAEAHDRLARQWDTARQYAAVQRALPAPREPDDLTELDAIATDIDTLLGSFHSSPGRWGTSEAAHSQRTVLTAVAYLTMQTGSRTVAAATRDLALMTGLGRTTAATALHALAAAGHLERVTKHDGTNAAEWRLPRTFSTTHRPVRPQPLINPRPAPELFALRSDLISTLEEQLTDQRHDLFTRAGLGHLAGRLYAVLGRHPSLTLPEAARIVGASIRHTATILSRLHTHKLAVRDRARWSRQKRDRRDQAARSTGVAGTLEGRARRYRDERQVWDWWQAELATMTATPRLRPRRPHVTSRTLDRDPAQHGERVWPRYPRDGDGRGDHREARYWVAHRMVEPDSLWWSSAA